MAAPDRRARGNDRIQMVGSEADTTKNSPLDERNIAFTGGMVEMVGSEAEMPRRTQPMGRFDKHVRGGTVEMVGSEVEGMFDRPQRGWDSYPTPIAQTSEQPQDAVSSFPSPGRKSGGR